MGILTTLAGAMIDRRDGDSGIKGALIGAATGRAIRALGPVGIAAVAGVALWRGLRKRRGA